MMPTQYPEHFDEFENPQANNFLNSTIVPHHLQHANANDAIEAIEKELGLQPSASFATVSERLNNIEDTFYIFTIDGGTF